MGVLFQQGIARRRRFNSCIQAPFGSKPCGQHDLLLTTAVFRVWTPRRMQGLSLGESMWSGAFVCPAS